MRPLIGIPCRLSFVRKREDPSTPIIVLMYMRLRVQVVCPFLFP